MTKSIINRKSYLKCQFTIQESIASGDLLLKHSNVKQSCLKLLPEDVSSKRAAAVGESSLTTFRAFQRRQTLETDERERRTG